MKNTDKVTVKYSLVATIIGIFLPLVTLGGDPGAKYHYAVAGEITIWERTWGLCLALVANKYQPEVYTTRKEMKHCLLPKVGSPFLTKTATLLGFGNGFLGYLDADDLRTYDLCTGQENTLKKWILNRPDNSVDPIEIFQKSLALNKGNLWNAILTIYQLLRNEARWWDYPRYQYSSSVANQEKLFDKFIDIRGNLRDLGSKQTGDHFGSWYRIWGAMLWRLNMFGQDYVNERIRAVKNGRPIPLGVLEEIQFARDNSAAGEVLYAGELSKVTSEPDGGKKQLNAEASSALTWLFQGVTNPALFKKFGINETQCRNRSYLGYQKQSAPKPDEIKVIPGPVPAGEMIIRPGKAQIAN